MARAFICGLAGARLAPEEKAFLRDARPWGVILFRRNVESRSQLRDLTDVLREALGDDRLPILVDQEGGRVQRLAPPEWRAYPSAASYERLGADLETAARLAFLGARLMAHDLREVGLTIDCLPVLDTPQRGAHQVIGDRGYSGDPARVARLGRAAADGLLASGVLPVMKHIPGHGRAAADSHFELPRVAASLQALRDADFAPFAANADLPIAMTAHVVFEAIDPERPASLSPEVIGKIVRAEIGFDGLLMTDDLSMQALSGDIRERAESASAAGCDLVLHCNGELSEARRVAEGAPLLAGKSLERADRALRLLERVEAFNPVDGEREFNAALASVA
ncbi:beta-N-acetylhexosaminidase [Methylocystis bryophila]|uniref:beta-N-acetylhexosaminidase n=1 Tax=Methylocystis bryophila TaxID=655015 RepID=A0A1W6MTJ9_9HYPH|nr:beta-N-acetylhexosaminidase [Methylocystis bryophila]ARN80846.1 beta-N-acetylhexosaminidase [Methylocystis bryophila]